MKKRKYNIENIITINLINTVIKVLLILTIIALIINSWNLIVNPINTINSLNSNTFELYATEFLSKTTMNINVDKIVKVIGLQETLALNYIEMIGTEFKLIIIII